MDLRKAAVEAMKMTGRIDLCIKLYYKRNKAIIVRDIDER